MLVQSQSHCIKNLSPRYSIWKKSRMLIELVMQSLIFQFFGVPSAKNAESKRCPVLINDCDAYDRV